MEPLAVVTRNNYIESIHYGYICIVDSYGKVLHNIGDYNTKIFFRSSAKPIQAIPMLQSGAAEAFNLSKKEIAITCSSHSGQKVHQDIVTDILKKLKLDVKDLHCGLIVPNNKDEKKRLLMEGKAPTELHCSCSGKHIGMLALAKYKDYDIGSYEKLSSPVQQEILHTIADFTDEDADSIPLGIDGCGVPIYLLPINKIALSYAKLTKYSQDPESSYYKSCKTIFEAMTEYPELIAGDYEFCTDLMKASNGRLIGKIGCEAVFCMGIKEGNLGICIKLVDGNERAVYPVVIQVLRELGVLGSSELNSLKYWFRQEIKNNLGETTGEILPAFSFNYKSVNHVSLGLKYFPSLHSSCID